MAAASAVPVPFVSVEEYLHTVYEPDMDYVDGVLEERNVGEMDHASVQRAILFALIAFEELEGVYAIQETRTQTQLTRFRVPDITLVRDENATEQIIRSAPLVCIEVMSPEDRLPRLRSKCQDYLRMGVPVVWIFDPEQEVAYAMREGDFVEVRQGTLRLDELPIALDVEQIFRDAKKRGRRS